MHTGVLDEVTKLNRSITSSAITITWKKPASLNLTTAEPDIVYCVDVYDGTDVNVRDHLLSNCSVFKEKFTFKVDNPDPAKLFQFVIIPRSNVEGGKNGTAGSIIGGSFSYEGSWICTWGFSYE